MSCISLKTIRDGTSQLQRLSNNLNPESVILDDREEKDIYEFIVSFAKEVGYYNKNNQLNGDWQAFFSELNSPEEFIHQYQDQKRIEPHLLLFKAFIEIWKIYQNELNEFPQRHLRFIYEDILKFRLKPQQPDFVHVILELSKNTKFRAIDSSVTFDAGTDVNGLKQFYKVTRETVISKGSIELISSVFVDRSDNYMIYAAPIANSQDGMGTESEQNDFTWKPFGESQKSTPEEQKNMKLAQPGFAFASPILYLSDGKRTVHLELTGTFREAPLVDPIDLNGAFNASISGVEEWIFPHTSNILLSRLLPGEDVFTMTIELVFNTEAPPLVNYDANVFTEKFESQLPVLKVEFDMMHSSSISYDVLSSFTMESGTISVDVEGMEKLSLFNDEGAIDSSKPFLPFGSNPLEGSSFYIGNSEVFGKSLSDLELFINYQNIPAELSAYYMTYFTNFGTPSWPPAVDINNDSFQANLKLLDKGNWENVLNTRPIKIFDSTDASSEYSVHIGQNTLATRTVKIRKDLSVFDRSSEIELLKPMRERPLNGYLTLEYTGTVNQSNSVEFTNFGRDQFPKIYTQIAIEKAKGTDAFDEIPLPNSPYIPLIKNIKLNYKSSQTLTFNNNWEIEQFFHILPFGNKEIHLIEETTNLLPEFNNEGYLYIGLKEFQPPNQVNMLFQLEEGSGDQTQLLLKEDINWSYLSNENWITIDSNNIISEQTKGFQTSGIIELEIGSDATLNNSSMPPELHWIRASVREHVMGAANVIRISTQAVLAEYMLSSKAVEENLNEELNEINSHIIPPNTIKKLIIPDSAIKKVSQPYSSFSGKSNENYNEFYSRVSERLRHKTKSVTFWDYERIILENFPSIFKVKCINHYNEHTKYAPGEITIVVVSNLRNKSSKHFLQPKTSATLRDEIHHLIGQSTSNQIAIHVSNPVYEPVLLDFEVKFKAGRDAGFFAKKLNEDIIKYLSPWAFEEGREIIFGDSVSKSDLMSFIGGLEYVDFLNNFFVYHNAISELDCPGIGEMEIELDFIVRDIQGPGLEEMIIEDNFIVGEPVEVALASSQASIIVSAPNHRIRVLAENELSCQGINRIGIGTMVLEVDFEVSQN